MVACSELLMTDWAHSMGHRGPLCHVLSLLSSLLLWTSMRKRCATVATPGEWQCKTGGMRRLAVANGPNFFQMLLVDICKYGVEINASSLFAAITTVAVFHMSVS